MSIQNPRTNFIEVFFRMIFGNNENTANNNTERFFIMAEYFNPGESRSLFNFTTSLQNLLEKKNYHSRDIVLVCIGSDRATGDYDIEMLYYRR